MEIGRKKRGRPAKAAPVEATETKETTRRRKRDIHGRKRQKLTTPELPGYFLKWVNDTGTNLHAHHQEDDFEFVTKDEIGNHIGEDGDGNTDLGNRCRLLVDTDENGNPIYAFLMKKPMEFHLEDKEAAEQARLEKEAQLKRGSDQIENITGQIR